jgi:hypothetical protein
MADNSALISAFRASYCMTVYASGQKFLFNLDGTSRHMMELVHCVQTELALEIGESPPSFASQPSVQPPRPSATTPAAPRADAELELAATRIASNLLLQAGLPNARLLSSAETPADI